MNLPDMDNIKAKSDLAEKIQKSGDNLHMRVVSFLRREGFDVQVSPTYRDETTGMVREVDILAKLEGKTDGVIALCVECKYLKSPVAFYRDACDLDELVEMFKIRFGSNDLGLSMMRGATEEYDKLTKDEKIARMAVPDEPILEACFQNTKASRHFTNKRDLSGAMLYQWIITDGGQMYSYQTDDYDKEKSLPAIEGELFEISHTFFGFIYDQEKRLIEIFSESHLPQRIQQLKSTEVGQINIFTNARRRERES